eukprot:7969948-Pyramimonas_sp.AAC.1
MHLPQHIPSIETPFLFTELLRQGPYSGRWASQAGRGGARDAALASDRPAKVDLQRSPALKHVEEVA